MPLTDSDELRLNVLLAQNPQAIKINESRLTLHALTVNGEARIELQPNTKPDMYLNQVREFLSSHVLGSKGGYPIFLKRWTRMGQARNKSLAGLLLLGEDEAVTAVIHAPGLDLDIAKLAWWVLPSADNARKMMAVDEISNSDFGVELSEFLLEFLAFEQEPQAMIDSVRLVLKASSADSPVRTDLWQKAARKTSYYVGFLQALPHELPESADTHPALNDVIAVLKNQGPEAALLLRSLEQVMSASGQKYLKTVKRCLAKPNNQDVVISLLNAIGQYFAVLNTDNRRYRDLQMWNNHARALLDERHIPKPDNCPDSVSEYGESIMALSMVDETMAGPVFSVSDAIGTVMRKRIKPITDEINKHIDRLLYS